MIGPSRGVGGELVAPHEQRNLNSSALAVMHGQDVLGEISRRFIIEDLASIGVLQILRHTS